MRDLVADDHADAAVVDGIVERGVEERRLEDAGQKHDLVGGGLEVRVHHLRRERELVPVHFLADQVELAAHFEAPGAVDVFKITVTPDDERGIIAPLEGKPDQRPETRELGQRLGAGGLAHPVGLLQVPLHGGLDVGHHDGEPRPDFGREIAVDIEPADRLPNLRIEHAGHPLPARLHRRHAVQHRAVEAKAFVGRGRRKIRRGIRQDAPAQVDLPVRERLFLQHPAHGREVLRLAHDDHLGLPGIADGCEIGVDRQARAGGGQFRNRHLVVVGEGITQLDRRLRDLGECLFQRVCRRRVRLCERGRFAGERKHFCHVFEVGGAVFFEAFVKIVVARRQPEAALRKVEDVGVALLLVRLHAPAEERRAWRGIGSARVVRRGNEPVMEHGDHPDQVVHGRDGVDAGEVGLDRFQAGRLNGGGVHRRGIKIADLLRERAGLAGLGGGLLQHALDEVAVALIKLIETAPARLVGGNLRGLVPVAGGVARKVDARIDGQIHVGDAEARHGRLGVSGGQGRNGGQKSAGGKARNPGESMISHGS